MDSWKIALSGNLRQEQTLEFLELVSTIDTQQMLNMGQNNLYSLLSAVHCPDTRFLIMNWCYRIGIALLLLANSPAHAFTTVDEQINHYLKILNSGSYAAKNQMLQRLQWSGLSNPRLYYRIETQVQFQGMLDDK